MQLVKVVHHNLVDGKVSVFALALGIHHRDKVALPVHHFRALLVSIVRESRYVFVLQARQLAAVGTYDVLHLPHIEHVFSRAFISELLGYKHVS